MGNDGTGDRSKYEIEMVGKVDKKQVNSEIKKVEKAVQDAGPVNISVELGLNEKISKKTSKKLSSQQARKLNKAQADTVNQIDTLTAKGLSASAKDIEKLTNDLQALGEVIDSLGISRNIGIFKEIRKQAEIIKSNYKAAKVSKATEVKITEAKTTDKSKPRKKRNEPYIDTGAGFSNEEIQANYEKEMKKRIKAFVSKEKELEEQAKEDAGAKGFKSDKSFKKGSTSNKTLFLSEFSEYASNWAAELARVFQEEMKKTAASLKIWTDPSEIGTPEKGKRNTDEQTQMKAIKNKAKSDLTNMIYDSEQGFNDIGLEDVLSQIVVIKSAAEELGEDLETTFKDITQAVQSIYDAKTGSEYSTKGGRKVGFATREEGKEKGVGPNHDNTVTLLKNMYRVLTEIWEGANPAEAMATRFATQESEAPKRVKSSTKKTDKKDKPVKSAYEDFKAQVKGSDEAIQLKELAKTVQNATNNILKETNKTATAVEEIKTEVQKATKAVEQNTSFDKIQNAKVNRETDKQSKIETENKTINEDTAKATETDIKTGLNPDKNADKLVDAVKAIQLPADQSGLYAAFPTKPTLALPKPDGRRKKISNGMEDENPPLGLAEIKKALSEALIPLEQSARTLKEAINPSVLDLHRWKSDARKQDAEDRRQPLDTQQSIREPDTDMESYMNRLRTTMMDEEDRTIAEDINRRKGKFTNTADQINIGSDDIVSLLPALIKDVMGNLVDTTKTLKETLHISKAEFIPSDMVQKSKIYASPIKQSVWDKLRKAISDLTGETEKYQDVLSATEEQQDQWAAERVTTWGMNNGRNPTDTGDIAKIRRSLELFRTNKTSIENNPELAQDLKLTAPIEVDTTKAMGSINKLLSGKAMRNAQMGGSPLRQVLGAMTGFVGMPSLEKSRASADAANQIQANIRDAMQPILDKIETNESILKGMEQTGEVKFGPEGNLAKGSSAAVKTLADLEEEKLVLQTILADMDMVNEAEKKSHGNIAAFVKQLKFTSPVLRDNNDIVRNIGAGLDKNGKSLKFQKRTAEILNYTFQLISRSIGQTLKNWISMINPITQIKKAFSDFTSYNTKWQRTMNVIKYNIRSIIQPFMDTIAQKLVNIIGFVDIISQKVQEGLGKLPVSLFDQAAASSEKINEELQAASNVTAGFDELHDIGSDNSGANDLTGEIYTPQLSEKWKELANQIGDLFKNLITGDLGFGDVAKEILSILGKTLKNIASDIWDWFKTTAIGNYITTHWKSILAKVLAIFLGWELLKIAGSTLFNAIFGSITSGAITSLFTKVGGWISGILGSTGFGSGIMLAFQTLFAGGKYSLLGTLKEMFTSASAITEAGSWGSMIGYAFSKGLLAILTGYLTYKVVDYFGDKATDNDVYNKMLTENGGDEDNKKSNVGNVLAGTLAGAAGGAATGFLVGGAPGAIAGAIIGGVAGVIKTTFIPAAEAAKTSIDDMNNSLQSTSYYEGTIDGLTNKTNVYDEQLDLLNQTMEIYKEKVYTAGEDMNISKERLDELIASVENGTYSTDMLSDSELGLSDSLSSLSSQQEHAKEVSEKLTEAQKKLEKAQTDLAIVQDMEAGNFELAAARVEYALASETYEGEEAAKKMSQIMQNANSDVRTSLLDDMSGELREQWNKYIGETDSGVSDLAKILAGMNDKEKEAFSKSYADDMTDAMEDTMDAAQKVIDDTSFDWSHPLKSLKSMFTGNWDWKASYASYDVGTSYVPNDGFAYIHKGEAIIPADENVFAKQGDAWTSSMASNDKLISVMTSLENTVKQGITVSGEFTQKGADLVAAVNKASSKNGNQALSNMAYAR